MLAVPSRRVSTFLRTGVSLLVLASTALFPALASAQTPAELLSGLVAQPGFANENELIAEGATETGYAVRFRSKSAELPVTVEIAVSELPSADTGSVAVQAAGDFLSGAGFVVEQGKPEDLGGRNYLLASAVADGELHMVMIFQGGSKLASVQVSAAPDKVAEVGLSTVFMSLAVLETIEPGATGGMFNTPTP
jgi:hypothetical protein